MAGRRRPTVNFPKPAYIDRPYGGDLSAWFERMAAQGRDVMDLRDQPGLAMDEEEYLHFQDTSGHFPHFYELPRVYRGLGYTPLGEWVNENYKGRRDRTARAK